MITAHRAIRSAMIVLCLAAMSGVGSSQTADPRRPSAITTEGVPQVPAELLARLAQYQNVRMAGFSGWEPQGKGILITTRFGNTNQLHQVYAPEGRREQLTFFDEPVTGGQFIPEAKDGSMLASYSAGGNENFQVYLVDRGAYRTVQLTDGKSRNEAGPVRDDGSQMVVLSNKRNGQDMDVYVAECRRPNSMRLVMQTSGQYWVATDWSPDGSKLFMIHYVSINENYPALLDVASGKLDKLPLPGAKGDKVAIESARFAPDGKTVYLTTDAFSEYHQLTAFDLATKKYRALVENIPWDVESIEVDSKTGQVAFTTNEDGAGKLYLYRADGAPREIPVPLGVIGGLEFSPDGKQLGFTLARPDAPAEAYSVPLDQQKLVRWTYSEVGGLNPNSFIKPERIAFTSFDGRTIPAYYYRAPKASKERPAPVLIDIHGGPEGQYRPLFSGPWQFLLNEMGIAIIAPNVRGSSGYGKTYLKLDNAEKREDSVKDIGGQLDWIAKQPELDAKRVAVSGGSYGGYMVLASLVNHGERIRAGIDIVGIANFITFLERTAPYRRDLRRAEYGDERDPKMRAVFERINPTAGASRIKSALLVAHGKNDPRVPFFEAQQIADVVRKQGRDVWSVYADNEGHGFGKKENRDYVWAAQILFLQRHLLGQQ